MTKLLLLLLLAPLAHGQTKLNIVEQAIAGAAITADVMTTRQAIGRGAHELNPVAKPFMRSNGGAVAAAGLGTGAVVFSNYLFRHHPRLRHGINWTVTAIETGNAIHNSQVR